MLGTDTAKKDLILVVIGFLAAGFFYWLYGSQHPLGFADSSLGKDIAAQQVSEEISRLGYIPSAESVSTFRADSEILDWLQLTEHTRDSLSKIVPAFYWHTDQKINIDERSAALMGIEAGNDRLVVKLSESGELLSFQNSSTLFPSRVIEDVFFEEHYPSINSNLQQLRTDANVFEKFQFQLNGYRTNRSNGLQGGGDIYVLTEEDVIRLAEYHLQSTGWPLELFSHENTELVVYHGVDVARVQFKGGESGMFEVYLELLPTGALISLDYTFSDETEVDETWSDIRFGTIVILILLFVIWILVLLFIRIRLRLIDIKLSVLIAVLVGFLIPMQFLFEWIYQMLYSLDEFTAREIFQRLFGLGIVAAIGSIFYFTTTAVGDSITRDNWSEKLRTFDLLRIGKIYNRPVGLVFIRSVVYSYLLAAIFALLFYLLPDTFLTVPETFRSDRTIFPSINVLVINGLMFLLIVQTLLLILVGKLRSYTKNWVWILLLTGAISALVGFFPVNIGPWTSDIIIAGCIGFAIGWIYFKEDLLTIFFSLMLLGLHLMSASGWVMESSPDSSVFYVSLLFIIILTGTGIFGVYKGQPIDQLPEYVPDYINDLKKDERIKQELQIARKVQKSFLPGKMPEGDGIEFAAICKPALETGGDYYDFIEIDENQLAVAIGDVSGKGIEAAFYMTFTKGVLHALCGEAVSTVDILAKINNLFIKNARKGTFISLIFGVINRKEGSFRFSRGGHNPLLYFSAEKGTVKEFRPSGIGLGMAGDRLFRENTSESIIQLNSGDIIVLFTDGVVEATNTRGHFYSDERLHRVIKRHSKLSAEKIINAITSDLYEFGEGADQHDDMTAIVIKKK